MNFIIKILIVQLILNLSLAGCQAPSTQESTPSTQESAPSTQESAPITTENSTEDVDFIHTENCSCLEHLRAIRQELLETDSICGVAFLGYTLDPYDQLNEFFKERGYMENYSFIAHIPEERFIDFEGDELYCLVPYEKISSLAINEFFYDEYFVGATGEVLYKSEESEPLLIRGNISDALPNLQIIMLGLDNQVLDYNPSISLVDGSLNIPWFSPFVHDFTLYDS